MSYYSEVMADSPAIYFRLDETVDGNAPGGNAIAYDSSGNNRHGTIHTHEQYPAMVNPVTNKIGRAVAGLGRPSLVDSGTAVELGQDGDGGGYIVMPTVPTSDDYTLEFMWQPYNTSGAIKPFVDWARPHYFINFAGNTAAASHVFSGYVDMARSYARTFANGNHMLTRSAPGVTDFVGTNNALLGVKQHVVFIRKGMGRTGVWTAPGESTFWLYINGVLAGSYASPSGYVYPQPTGDIYDVSDGYGTGITYDHPASYYPNPPIRLMGAGALIDEVAYYTHALSEARITAHNGAKGTSLVGTSAANLRAMTSSANLAVPVKVFMPTAGASLRSLDSYPSTLNVPVDMRTAVAGVSLAALTTGVVTNPVAGVEPEITWDTYGEPNTLSTGLDPSAAGGPNGWNLMVPPTLASPDIGSALPTLTSDSVLAITVGEYISAIPRMTASGRMIAGLEDAEVYSIAPVSLAVSVELPAPEDMPTLDVLTLPPIRLRTAVSLTISTPVPDTTVYRVRVVDLNGNLMAELENAVLQPVQWKVTGMTSFVFTLPAHDPKAEWVQEVRREVQVWRNDRLLWWGPILRTTNNGKTLEAQCMDTRYYFSRRVVGRVPKENLLVSEDGMPAGISGWEGAYLPRSEPKANPAKTSTVENTYNDKASMRLSSSTGKERDTYSNDDWYDGTRLTSKAKTDIRKVMDAQTEFTEHPRIAVKVYDDNTGTRENIDARAQVRADAVADFILDNYPDAKVALSAPAYRDAKNDNGTVEKRKANRRTLLIYKSVDGVKGHKQHVRQFVTLRNPKPTERKQLVSFTAYVYIEDESGWAAGLKGVEVVRADPRRKHPDPKWASAGYKKPLQTSVVTFGDGFPTEKWARVVCSVVLPNNGKKSQIEVRLFPPNGDILFSEMWLTREQSLTFRRQEQADIIRTLVEHAQDPAMGKSPLNIGTNIPKTGVKRSRDYPWEERASVLDLLEEFPTLADGMEWSIDLTPDTRTLTTHFPRMGRDTDVVLAYGSNAVSYGVASDGTLIATTVIIQAPTGDDHTREERTVSDPTLMDGVIMETAYDGTPNSPASSWMKQAERGLARYRRPITMPSVVMDPAFTDELLDTVAIGDRLLTNISDDVANVDSITKCRVMEISLNPATDSLTFDLFPEDLGVQTISAFGSPVRYFSQAQNPIVGASGSVPVQSNPEFAARAYDDSAWPVGAAGVGWVKEATGDLQVRATYIPNTVVPGHHEVWIRKTVYCTGDMVLTLRVSDWGYLYVNGHLVGNDHFTGYNRFGKAGFVNLRIPSTWLDPSGNQLIALHAQFNPAKRSGDEMDSVYADVAVRGTVDPSGVV